MTPMTVEPNKAYAAFDSPINCVMNIKFNTIAIAAET